MKKLFLILALAGILLQTFSKGFILLNFQLNRDYIAQNLCVKKEIKGNCCQGSCHLQKQLEKHEQQESTQRVIKDTTELQWLCQDYLQLDEPALSYTDLPYPVYTDAGASRFSFSVFHPPRC